MLDTCKGCDEPFNSSNKYIHYCQKCRYKKHKTKVLQVGLCQKCGSKPPVAGFKFCQDCRGKYSEYHKNWNKHQADKLPEIPCSIDGCTGFRHSIRSSFCRECHVKQLCSMCGVTTRRTNTSWCTACTKKSTDLLKQERLERGFCTKCGQHPAVEDEKRCVTCSHEDSKRRRTRRRTKKEDVLKALNWVPNCHQCGFTTDYLDVLQFDHINPEEKKHDISKMLSTYPMKEIVEEALKCRLLCPTCHAIRHVRDNELKYKGKVA